MEHKRDRIIKLAKEMIKKKIDEMSPKEFLLLLKRLEPREKPPEPSKEGGNEQKTFKISYQRRKDQKEISLLT